MRIVELIELIWKEHIEGYSIFHGGYYDNVMKLDLGLNFTEYIKCSHFYHPMLNQNIGTHQLFSASNDLSW